MLLIQKYHKYLHKHSADRTKKFIRCWTDSGLPLALRVRGDSRTLCGFGESKTNWGQQFIYLNQEKAFMAVQQEDKR